MANTYYDSQLTAAEIEAALEAIDGVIVPANNGKVLAINNGKLEARSVQWGGGSTLEPLSVTANGYYYPEAGVDGFDEVHVSVSNSYTASDEGKVVSNGALVAQTARSSQITQNGTYDTTLNNEVTINVSGGGSAVVQSLSVTQNGTYNPPSGVDGYAPVVVNVSGGGSTTYNAIHVWTKDAASYNANLYIQTGTVTDDAFTATGEQIILAYNSTDAANGKDYGNLVNVKYLESSGGGANWQVKAIDSVAYNSMVYASGDVLETWAYNQTKNMIVRATSGGGGGGIPLLSRSQWEALTEQQKKSYGLVAIQDVITGYIRGDLVNGADFVGEIVQSGTGSAPISDSITVSGSYVLVVLALNSEASTYQLNIDAKINGTSVTGETVIFNSYSGSGDNRRNYRLNQYPVTVSSGDTISIEVTNTSSFSSFVWALLNAGTLILDKAISTADMTASGSNVNSGFVLMGTFNSSSGGTIELEGYTANDTVTTQNPGTNYKSAYIFWFT